MRGFGEKGYWIGGLGRVDGKKKVILKIQLGRKEEEKSIMVFDLMVESVFFSIFGHVFWVFFCCCVYVFFFMFFSLVFCVFSREFFLYVSNFFIAFICLSSYVFLIFYLLISSSHSSFGKGLKFLYLFCSLFPSLLIILLPNLIIVFQFSFFSHFVFENMLEIKVKQRATCHVSRLCFLYTPYIFVLMPSFDNFVTFEPLKILDSCKFYIHEFL